MLLVLKNFLFNSNATGLKKIWYDENRTVLEWKNVVDRNGSFTSNCRAIRSCVDFQANEKMEMSEIEGEDATIQLNRATLKLVTLLCAEILPSMSVSVQWWIDRRFELKRMQSLWTRYRPQQAKRSALIFSPTCRRKCSEKSDGNGLDYDK